MFVCLSVLYAFLNSWTDFDEIFCVWVSVVPGMIQIHNPVGPPGKVLKQGFWDLQ